MTTPTWLDTLIYGVRTILSRGVELTQRNKLNFAEPLVASDDDSNTRTNVTITPDFGSDNIITSGYVAIGATLPTAGDLRVKYGFVTVGLDAAGTGEVNLLQWTDDILYLGANDSDLEGIELNVPTGKEITLYVGGSGVVIGSTVSIDVPVTMDSTLRADQISIGTTTPAGGDLMVENGFVIRGYDAAGTGPVNFLTWGTDDKIIFGTTDTDCEGTTIETPSAKKLLLKAGTVEVIDIAGNLVLVNVDLRLAAGKDLDCQTSGAYFKPRRVSQDAQPTPDSGELMIWYDSNAGAGARVKLLYNDPTEGVAQFDSDK